MNRMRMYHLFCRIRGLAGVLCLCAALAGRAVGVEAEPLLLGTRKTGCWCWHRTRTTRLSGQGG